ncbi:hypothetical protein EDC04DRAFT_470880 [Pisolithus marmoratus]|nr:hypothetical protein EDC04DRAFT_470880 [Pisolithus marmoratus]
MRPGRTKSKPKSISKSAPNRWAKSILNYPSGAEDRILALLEESFPVVLFVMPSLLSFRRYRPLTGERPWRTNFGISSDWRRAQPLFTSTPLSSPSSRVLHTSRPTMRRISRIFGSQLYSTRPTEGYRKPNVRRYSVAYICFVSPPALSSFGLCVMLGESYLAVYTAI